jgi:serine/threonine-protein kinase
MSRGAAGGDGLVGTVLQDSYRVIRLVGRGGMGTVYEATQLRLNKRVAIKVLAREQSSNEEALARFRREAEVTSQLGHPHIVQVNDFGSTPSGEPYLVMEFLEGEDLDQRIRRARSLPLPTAANIIKQIASALSSTHARGIVHRDLKPANVFLMEVEGESDFVKIVDFGISKVRAASLRLTGASAVIGTPNYMSPEQAAGQIEAVDHRTDQWSLACIAYEMLTGRGPFLGETIHSLLYQVINQEPPPLTSLNRAVPPEIEKIVARGMSKQSADRFPTISAFSRAFTAAAAGGTASIASVPAPARVARESAAPRAAAAPAPPSVPQPTTLSRTASELDSTLSRLRAGLTSKWAAVGGAALLAAVALVVLRPRSVPPGHAVSTSARRFNVFVLSDPAGAEIFLGDANTAAGVTPATIPIDLTGFDSVRLRLKKSGYEDFDQIVVDDTPMTFSLKPIAVVAPIPAPPPAPPAAAAPEAPPEAPVAEPARPKRSNGPRSAGPASKPATARPKPPNSPTRPARGSIIEEL